MKLSRRAVIAAGVAGFLSFHRRGIAADADSPAKVVGEPAFLHDKGIWEISIESPYQRGRNAVRILLPDGFKKADAHRVLYLLPVEEGLGTKWGEPLAEVRGKELHNRHNVICVYPTFDTLPWYGRHATDKAIRHELYMTRALIPLIEERYKTPGDASGRLMVGFSKSGWGAVSLILRNPDLFGVAGSWDAPLMMEEQDLGLFGTKGHFGEKATFADYLPTKLIARAAGDFQKRSRLVITGHDSFGPNPPQRFKDHPHTEAFHQQLTAAGIKHVYNNDLKVKHHWNSGWLPAVIEEMMKLADKEPRTK